MFAYNDINKDLFLPHLGTFNMLRQKGDEDIYEIGKDSFNMACTIGSVH
jgi:hypothetical protein